MEKFRIVFLVPLLGIHLLGLSCAAFTAKTRNQAVVSVFIRDYESSGIIPANTGFVFSPLPELFSAPGVGLVTLDERDLGGTLARADRDRLRDSFKNAYIEGILRGIRLEGVLGGDLVHGWPQTAPITWVQNWRSSTGSFNSWGTPDLILAVQGLNHDRVFLIQGDILNMYGTSAGIGGANGAAGYGAPCGEEFFLNNRAAQRFDYGVITYNDTGHILFIAGDPPSVNMPVPQNTGLMLTDDTDPHIREKFQSAWRTGVDTYLPPLEPDARVISIQFQEPWLLPVEIADNLASGAAVSNPPAETGEKAAIAVSCIYYQVFGEARAVFIMADAELEYSGQYTRLPAIPRIVASPFLDVLLNTRQRHLSGAENLNPARIPAYPGTGANFSRILLDGIALYGIPLSNALPWNEEGVSFEVQRFSRGWLTAQ